MKVKYPNAVIMIFCKAPIIGQVKTRLISQLTAEQATEVHIKLAERTLQLVTLNQLCAVQLWCTPSIDHPFFKACALTYPISLLQQTGLDLGERMSNAFCMALINYSCALLIGCDCPSLIQEDLEEALFALHQKESCVLAPAEDGGYVLIGLNQPHPELFLNIEWGTDQVFDHTCRLIKQNNLNYHALNQQWDIDTPEDLARYQALQLN
jgi:hypothetical protein